MQINKLKLKIKYQDELNILLNQTIIQFDVWHIFNTYIFKHTKNDLTINFLQNHNIDCPIIVKTILKYILYGEDYFEFKYIINFMLKNINNQNIKNNIGYIFQFFTNYYAQDLTDIEKQKSNNRIITYINKICNFILTTVNDFEYDIPQIFHQLIFVINLNKHKFDKIFFNILFKYFNKWIKITNILYEDKYDVVKLIYYFTGMTDNYKIFRKIYKNKQKLIQFAKKYYKY